jgi:hypothetical protein
MDDPFLPFKLQVNLDNEYKDMQYFIPVNGNNKKALSIRSVIRKIIACHLSCDLILDKGICH